MDIPKEARGLRTWVEIDLRALEKNTHAVKRFLGKKTLLCGVVKSNAYGHGLVPVARALASFGADWLGVDSAVEAFRLREKGVRIPLLVLGYTLPAHFARASKEKISLTVSNMPALEKALTWVAETKKPLSVHLKIDTGMHRQGFLPEEMPALKKILQEISHNKHSNILKNVGMFKVEGMYSHLADPNPKAPASARAQIRQFKKSVAELPVAAGKPLLHIGATAGAACFPDPFFTMARIGIALYGMWPSMEVRDMMMKKKTKLTPVLSWRTIVGEVKKIKKGERVGYGFTEKVLCDSTIAVLPVGYWHGYPRALSGKAPVLIRGKRAKVLGRVSMDMTVVDVTDIRGVAAGDAVTLIGKDGAEEITAGELAERAGTISHEILTRINPLVERITTPTMAI